MSLRFAGTALACLALLSLTHAAAQHVAWKPAADIQGDADISHAGTPVDAILGYAGPNVQGLHQPAADMTIGDTTFHVPHKSGDSYGDGIISFVGGSPVAFSTSTPTPTRTARGITTPCPPPRASPPTTARS